MTTKQLADIRQKVYNQAYENDEPLPETMKRMFEYYDTRKAFVEFTETPLRWYPSGKKVYNWRFQFTVYIKGIGVKLKFWYWLLKSKLHG